MRLGYLSVGEADPRRPYGTEVRAAPFLVEPDPAWPDNFRVDVRDRRWQQILLGEEIPRLLAQGFDGLMLDTIDTAPYLEGKDPARFAGSRQALRDFVREIRTASRARRSWPTGSPASSTSRPSSTASSSRGCSPPTTSGGASIVRPRPSSVTGSWGGSPRREAIAHRPVFTIDYADVGDIVLAHWAESEAVGHGFKPYVGVRDLNTLP